MAKTPAACVSIENQLKQKHADRWLCRLFSYTEEPCGMGLQSHRHGPCTGRALL